MDVLSDVLAAVRLTGAIFFDSTFREPWVAEAPRASVVAAKVMPDSQYVFYFHTLLEGSCWVEMIDGSAEPLPGLHVIPTPGHVDGHQSLVVECDDGSVVLAGQSHEHASDWTAPDQPGWMARLLEFDPRRVVFAHDDEEWRP